MQSYYEATARERIAGIVDAGSWREILPPTTRTLSPHLAALDLPTAFDDGVVIGEASLEGLAVLVAAQEGGFMGGAWGYDNYTANPIGRQITLGIRTNF